MRLDVTNIKVADSARGRMGGQPVTLPPGFDVLGVAPVNAPGWLAIYHDRYTASEDPGQSERRWRLHITDPGQPLPMRWDWRGLVLLDGVYVMVHMERQN